jgi:hypothetical protein
VADEVRQKYERAIQDYLVLREAAKLEISIMDANRVNVEKNMKQIIN